ncbi:MAG: DUF4279 domain-containing protein [Bacteroidales bacterium]|jgi:hypothetical protein|nr:DUF4279 domain-containing protein [Bacteroidales bacterium]
MEPKIKINFNLIGKNVDLDDITEQLGILPSSKRTLDDWPDCIKDNISKLPEELWPRYIWELIIDYEPSRTVRQQLNQLMNHLQEKIQIINELREKYALRIGVEVIIIIMESGNQPEMFLPRDVVEFLASIHADIGFDMYID